MLTGLAGVATEVELGRLEGGEAGLRQIEGTIFTDPSKAETFLKEYIPIRYMTVSADNPSGPVLISSLLVLETDTDRTSPSRAVRNLNGILNCWKSSLHSSRAGSQFAPMV